MKKGLFIGLLLMLSFSVFSASSYDFKSIQCYGEASQDSDPVWGNYGVALEITYGPHCFSDILGQRKCRDLAWRIVKDDTVELALNGLLGNDDRGQALMSNALHTIEGASNTVTLSYIRPDRSLGFTFKVQVIESREGFDILKGSYKGHQYNGPVSYPIECRALR